MGGEQYILSAVMHADEINRAMTEALGREVYHYHLHVVYVSVVEKQILWSKRCKDKALVGTVKETVMQVSRSKKWASKPLLDDAGKPVLQMLSISLRAAYTLCNTTTDFRVLHIGTSIRVSKASFDAWLARIEEA